MVTFGSPRRIRKTKNVLYFGPIKFPKEAPKSTRTPYTYVK